MLATFILTATLSLGNLNFEQLESFYWDCDTLFMKGEMGGQDTMSCLAITETFQQKYFWDKFVFSQYWNSQKKQQWAKRGYKHKDEHDD